MKARLIIILNNPNTAALIFQGVGGNALPYALDGWAISTPAPLNRVANDKAVVIKNLQNYMHTYEVVFVGSNTDYISSTSEVKTMTINIIDKF